MSHRTATSLMLPVGLTIGTAVYKDPIGLYFTLQALRMYHAEVMPMTEIIVVDNCPDSREGHMTRDIVSKANNARYIPYTDKTSTSVREQVFQQAKHDFVLCLDAHVLIRAGALRQLLTYFINNNQTKDLLQGPLWYDELGEETVATHFQPTWGAHMYGQWATDVRGVRVDAEPFDIPMQGLGLFACRKSVWPSFSKLFRGFGGEEGYLHEKIRQRGGRCLCLPFLRWVHCFHRVNPAPYPCTIEDRFWNYLVGWRELGLDTGPILENFRGSMSQNVTQKLLDEAIAAQPVPTVIPVSSATMQRTVQTAAQLLLGMPAGERQTAMAHLKTKDQAMYSLIRAHLQELLSDLAS